ncbi:MAG: peptidoglycan DD-metalloendopeptidase family protein [Oligoflexia bacterium]|nr:peptidoglycan DD-metalloendopeptidase family protein [Oligoflexia bacterium]
MRLFLLLFLFVPLSLAAQGATQPVSLANINQQVESEGKRLAELSGRHETLLKEMQTQNSDLRGLKTQEESSRLELKQLQAKQSETEREIKGFQQQIAELRDLYLKRVRALYMRGEETTLALVGMSDRGQEMGRFAVYLHKLSAFDQSTARTLRDLIGAAEKRRAELAVTLEKKEQVVGKLAAQRKEIEEKLAVLKNSAEELKQQRADINASIAGLKAQALRLETVVASLTGEPAPPPKKSEAPSPKQETDREPFIGPGLFRLKGSLALPVRGQVIQKYGKQKIPKFEDFVFVKGIEYKVEEGAEIKAIAPGKVIFLGRMPGYGTIAIVDHGERYYSLYGRLGQTLVERSQIVDKGAVLARAGTPDEGGKNFYFEIRRGGAPVNPQEYFKRL